MDEPDDTAEDDVSSGEAAAPDSSANLGARLFVLGAMVVAALWLSPLSLQASIVSDGSATWQAIGEPHSAVLTSSTVEADGWLSVEFRSVGAVPGAEVVGAWLLPTETTHLSIEVHAEDYDSLDDIVHDLLPLASAETELTKRLDRGKTAQLWILWEVTDCGLLVAERTPRLAIGTVIGTTRHESLEPITSPAFDVEALVAAGICPEVA